MLDKIAPPFILVLLSHAKMEGKIEHFIDFYIFLIEYFCSNNRYCMVGSNGAPTCVCTSGYSGTSCQTCNFLKIN